MSTIIDFADRLRTHADIVEIVEGYFPLRRGGANLKAPCPFHREKSPSFTVSPSKQIFHCFGCHEGGDVIKFVQKIERIEWIEAVRVLADHYGLQLPGRQDSSQAQESRDEKDRLTAICEMACARFQDRLAKAMSDPAREITEYLARRGITADDARKFRLGLAPDEWTDFTDAAHKAGYPNEALVAAGLAMHKAETGRFYDRFRNRLIFPILTPRGVPVAFGARMYSFKAGPDEPKYINSPETPLYHKGQFLYAMSLARDSITSTGYALLMEGYMDVLRAHQQGFANAVATCGTALTEEQARTLKRVSSNVRFVYDGDEAGQNAMIRGTEILLSAGFESIRIVILPNQHDPDSFLREFGAEAFRQQVDQAENYFDFFLARARAQFNAHTPEGKAAIVEKMLPLLRRIGRGVTQSAYVRQLADVLDIRETLVLRQLTPRQNPSPLADQLATQPDTAQSAAERKMLHMLFECESARQSAFDSISPEWLRDDQARKWFIRLRESANTSISWEEWMKDAGEEDASFLRGLALMEESCSDPVQTIRHLATRFQRHYLIEQNRRIERQVRQLHLENEHDGVQDLCRECDESAKIVKDTSKKYFRNRPVRDTGG